MEIKPKNHKTFIISHQHRELATVAFPSVWKLNAKASFAGRQLDIKSTSAWGGKYVSTLDGYDRASIKMNWKGCTRVSLLAEDGTGIERTMNIKRASIWRSDYIISDERDSKLALIKGHWSWRKFTYSYEVTQFDLMDENFLIEMLIYTLFLHKVHLNQSAAA